MTTAATAAQRTVKPWPLVAEPHDDVRKGHFDMAQFAANLGAVDRDDQGCPELYRKPVMFYRATWRTKALDELLRHVSSVLAGGPGDRVLQLRTPFGGGKTHTLIALLHLMRSRRTLTEAGVLDSAWPDPGPVDVVVLPCLDLDPAAGRIVAPGVRLRTLWGELAWRVGKEEGYALVREADEARVQAGEDALRALFKGRRVLVLLDEVLTYLEGAFGVVVGESSLGRQTLAFLQHLTEVISHQPHVAVVYSLQKSIGQALGNEELLHMLDNLVSRVDAKREPVSGDDVLRVVQRRLFAELGPQSIREDVAQVVADEWVRGRSSQPLGDSERRGLVEQADRLRSRIMDSYPFHPELLDLMYHRWGALPSYQRTRGALQFLASVVHAVHATGASAGLLIGPGDVPLENDAVRQALFSQVGATNDWTAVLAADVAGPAARCKAVDRAIAIEAPTLGVQRPATRLAQALVLYSFGAREGEDRGVLQNDLLDVVQTPDAPRDVLEGPLQQLADSLLYLHQVGRHMRFDKKPNLNKLVDDAAKSIQPEEVLAHMRKVLEPLLGERSASVVWPKHHDGVADRQARFLVVFWPVTMALETPEHQLETARQWTEHCGPARRQYRNALCFAVPTGRAADDARAAARRVLACQELLGNLKGHGLTVDDKGDLEGRAGRAQGELLGSLRALYTHVLLPVAAPADATDPIRVERFDIPVQHSTGSQLVEAARKAVERLVTPLCTAARLAQMLHLGSGPQFDATHFVHGPTVVDHVFGNVAFPKLLTLGGLQASVARGVTEGRLGWVDGATVNADGLVVANELDVTLSSPIDAADVLGTGGYVVSPEYARQLREKLLPPKKPNDNTTTEGGTGGGAGGGTSGGGGTGGGGMGGGGGGGGGTRTTGRRMVKLHFKTKGDSLFNAMAALADLSTWAKADFVADVTIEARGHTDLDEHTYKNQVRGAIDEVAEIVEG